MKLGREEREAIAKALAVLPADHPARLAQRRGADPVALIQLIERDDVLEALESIWLSAYRKKVTRAPLNR